MLACTPRLAHPALMIRSAKSAAAVVQQCQPQCCNIVSTQFACRRRQLSCSSRKENSYTPHATAHWQQRNVPCSTTAPSCLYLCGTRCRQHTSIINNCKACHSHTPGVMQSLNTQGPLDGMQTGRGTPSATIITHKCCCVQQLMAPRINVLPAGRQPSRTAQTTLPVHSIQPIYIHTTAAAAKQQAHAAQLTAPPCQP
jgi:hypothetical protein